MKSLAILIFFLFPVCIINAQVGIDTESPQAALDIKSSDAGLLIPRVTLSSSTDVMTVTNPDGSALVTSTLVYNTMAAGDLTEGFHFWDGSAWQRLTSLIDQTEQLWNLDAANNRTELTNTSDGSPRAADNNVYFDDNGTLAIDRINTDPINGGSRKIQVYNGDIANYTYLNNAASYGFIGHKSRGSELAPIGVRPNDDVTAIFANPFNGTNFTTSSYMQMGVDRNYIQNDLLVPGDFRFYTSSATSNGEKIRFTNDGRIGVLTNVPNEMLVIHGSEPLNYDADLDMTSYSNKQ